MQKPTYKNKKDKHKPLAVFINILLLILLIVTLLIFPKEISSYFVPYRNLVFSVSVLLILLIVSLYKDLQNKNIAFNYFDFIALGFIIINFLSWFWASQPALIWYKSFAFLQLYVIYKLFHVINLKILNRPVFELVILGICIFNCFFVAIVFIDIMYKPNGFYLLYDDLIKVSGNFEKTTNLTSAILLITLPSLLFINIKSIYLQVLAALQIGLIFLFNARASSIALLVFGLFLLYNFYKTSELKKVLKFMVLVTCITIPLIFIIGEKKTYFTKYMIDSPFEAQDNNERIKLWENSILLFKEKPLLGIGSGNWVIEHLKFGSSKFKLSFNKLKNYKHAHNLFFESLAETGIIGFSLLILAIIYCIVNFFKLTQRNIKLILAFPMCFFVLASFYGEVITLNNEFKAHSIILAVSLSFFLIEKKYIINKKIALSIIIFLSMTSVAWNFYQLSIFNKISKANATQNLSIIENTYREIYVEGLNEYYRYKPIEISISQILFKQNKKGLALKVYELGLKKDPHNFIWHNQLAKYYLVSNRNNRSKYHFEKAYGLNKNIFTVNIWLAKFARDKNNQIKVKKYLSFYQDWLLPAKEKYYSESYWDLPVNDRVFKYWKNICEIEDRVNDFL